MSKSDACLAAAGRRETNPVGSEACFIELGSDRNRTQDTEASDKEELPQAAKVERLGWPRMHRCSGGPPLTQPRDYRVHSFPINRSGAARRKLIPRSPTIANFR